jgi:hypothetical protein
MRPRALRGKKEITGRWLIALIGRATDPYGGKVFELLEKAKKLCWQS